MRKNILHITDLHLNNFDGTTEHLRKRFYEEYIDGLIIAIEKDSLNIDYLIITGDFIDRAKTENFENVRLIIKYICSKLNIDITQVCCNIGNHDYKWKEENGDFSKSKESRKSYCNFIEPYDGEILIKSDRFFLKKLDSEVFFLSIDSTLNSEQGKPGNITDEEMDEIICDVLKVHINENSTLLIGCHFPIITYENSFLSYEEDNWHENHVWTKGAALRERISQIKTLHTLWFHGDVHAGDQKRFDNSTFILTGRFGGDISSISEFPRQCKIICLTNLKQSVYTYSFLSKTHKPTPSLGTWTTSGESNIRVIEDAIKTPENTSSMNNLIKIIDDEIEEQIMLDISNNDLFKFGRFKTNQDFSSLGWININKLMNESILLSRILEKSIKHIKTIVKSNSSECLIIGLEVIGGIIASQVSVQVNSKNYIYPIRGNGKFYSPEERDTSSLFSDLQSMKEIVIFIDVISSGKTINQFLKELQEKNDKIIIHIISIISNNISSESAEKITASSYATFCNKLKIPLIKNENLPDEFIFPPILDFT